MLGDKFPPALKRNGLEENGVLN